MSKITVRHLKKKTTPYPVRLSKDFISDCGKQEIICSGFLRKTQGDSFFAVPLFYSNSKKEPTAYTLMQWVFRI
jgi:hypothetical protein